jgi:hypothetical protein
MNKVPEPGGERAVTLEGGQSCCDQMSRGCPRTLAKQIRQQAAKIEGPVL